MGEVIIFPTPCTETAIPAADERLSHGDVALLTTIRDNIETLLDMMADISRDPAAVAARFGIMRIFHLNGLAAALGFAKRCIETAKIAKGLSQH